MAQQYTSKATSISQIARTFKEIAFCPGDRILDWGGGRYDFSQDYMKSHEVSLAVYDKYNRSNAHNEVVLNGFFENPADAITVNNVLNVIAEIEERKKLLLETKKYLKPGGVVYFIVYEGDGSGIGRQTGKDQFQLNLKTKEYIPEIEQIYEYVKQDGKYLRASDSPLEVIPRLSISEKAYFYNQDQKQVGGSLKTLKGSLVSRGKLGVGKNIGGQIYVHKDYVHEVVPFEVISKAKAYLEKEVPDFLYQCCMYDATQNRFRFDEAPDFDTAREPHPGQMVTVALENGDISISESHSIWHHKWMWVKDDYEGFSVADSWNWSKKWLSFLQEPASGSLCKWKEQLTKVELLERKPGIDMLITHAAVYRQGKKKTYKKNLVSDKMYKI